MPVGVLSSDSAENEGVSGPVFGPKDALRRIAHSNRAARPMAGLLCLSSFIPNTPQEIVKKNNHLTAFQLTMSISFPFALTSDALQYC